MASLFDPEFRSVGSFLSSPILAPFLLSLPYIVSVRPHCSCDHFSSNPEPIPVIPPGFCYASNVSASGNPDFTLPLRASSAAWPFGMSRSGLFSESMTFLSFFVFLPSAFSGRGKLNLDRQRLSTGLVRHAGGRRAAQWPLFFFFSFPVSALSLFRSLRF